MFFELARFAADVKLKQGFWVMWRIILISLMALTTINCTTLSDSRRMEISQRNPRRDALDRAHALFQIGEYEAALKSLSRIIKSEQLDNIGQDAVLLSADIYLHKNQTQKAIDILESFLIRAKGGKLNVSHLEKAIQRAKSSLKIVREKTIVIAPKKEVKVEEVKGDHESPVQLVARSVGVILPLSGAFKIYGERILGAMKQALGEGAVHTENGAIVFRTNDGFSLIALDSMGLPKSSMAAVDRLRDEYQVGVIVGDILSETAFSVAKRSKERDIINLSLSRKDGITAIGPKVFRFGITAKKQSDSLLAREYGNGNLKNVAVLYPENTFGIEMRDAFVASAAAKGITVSKVVGYSPTETTFTNRIRELVGPKKVSENENYAQCLEKAKRILDLPALKKAERDCYDNVASSPKFEALFIPDFPKMLGYIIPALISEGVMVSQNEDILMSYRRTSGQSEAHPIQLIGPNSWNSESIGEKLGPQIDGALFVDSNKLNEVGEDTERFVTNFTKEFGSPPSFLEGLGFDAISSLHRIFMNENDDKKDLGQVIRSLLALQHEGVCGSISFDNERESTIPLHWFSFQDGKIVERL